MSWQTVNSSPVLSLRWSILYWGVEYKSRQTGPFSVVTKSKDVPFEVGITCGSSSEYTNQPLYKRSVMGSSCSITFCPTKAKKSNLTD